VWGIEENGFSCLNSGRSRSLAQDFLPRPPTKNPIRRPVRHGFFVQNPRYRKYLNKARPGSSTTTDPSFWRPSAAAPILPAEASLQNLLFFRPNEPDAEPTHEKPTNQFAPGCTFTVFVIFKVQHWIYSGYPASLRRNQRAAPRRLLVDST